MNIEVLADYKCHLGEGPLWHPTENKLYWLDIHQGMVLAYNLSDNKYRVVYEGEPVGGMTLQDDGSLLFLMTAGKIGVWRKGKLNIVSQITDEYERGRRFNDAIADPVGRVFTGSFSMDDKTGRLYRINTDCSYEVLAENVKVPNGMAFSKGRKHLYFTETRAWKIHIFDYSEETGGLSHKRTFIDVPRDEKEGRADGLTIDEDGYLWSARFDGGIIVRYNPDGIEETRIPIPTSKVTSLTFGGENLEDLFITTASGNIISDDYMAGALLKLRTGVRGMPGYSSRIGL